MADAVVSRGSSIVGDRSPKEGFVYCLTNPYYYDAISGYRVVKIGCTTKRMYTAEKAIGERLRNLFGGTDICSEKGAMSGVPHPFECVFYLETFDNCKALEHIIHKHFEEFRCYSKREFFILSIKEVKEYFESLTTPRIVFHDERIIRETHSKSSPSTRKNINKEISIRDAITQTITFSENICMSSIEKLDYVMLIYYPCKANCNEDKSHRECQYKNCMNKTLMCGVRYCHHHKCFDRLCANCRSSNEEDLLKYCTLDGDFHNYRPDLLSDEAKLHPEILRELKCEWNGCTNPKSQLYWSARFCDKHIL
jgi:hypothetical protein